MAPPNENFTFLDKNILSALMKKMDKDVATRLAISAVSLNPKKINDAVGIAFQEMAIRSKEKKKLQAKTQDAGDTQAQAKELVDAITAILKSGANVGAPADEGDDEEFEMEIITPEDDEEDNKS